MNTDTPLRQKWATFVQHHSRWRACPYCSLLLTLLLLILQFTKYAHFHFLLMMILLTIMLFERLAFAELLAARDSEIKRLQHENNVSV